MRRPLKFASFLFLIAELACGQSKPAEATTTIAGKTLTIKYSAPTVRGRQIFGDGGVVSHDKTYRSGVPERIELRLFIATQI